MYKTQQRESTRRLVGFCVYESRQIVYQLHLHSPLSHYCGYTKAASDAFVPIVSVLRTVSNVSSTCFYDLFPMRCSYLEAELFLMLHVQITDLVTRMGVSTSV